MEIIENYYDIVILPSSSIKDFSIQLSKKVNKQFESNLVLGEKENIPHISLLHTAFAKKDLDNLKERLINIVRNFQPFETTINKLLTYPKHGALALNSLANGEFVSLHKKIIKGVDDLVDRNFDYHKAWQSEKLPSKMREYIEEYTTPFIDEYFVPHITLSVLKDKTKTEEAAKILSIDKKKFKASKISVCVLGEHHTCQDIVFEVSLSD